MNEQEVAKEFLFNVRKILSYIEGQDVEIRSILEGRNHHRLSEVEQILQEIESLRNKTSVVKKVKSVQQSTGQDDKE